MLRVVEAVERTDTGRQREANEDSYFSRAPVFAVADGMGGAQAGEVASRMAVEAFEPERDAGVPAERYLSETARRANRQIFELAQGDSSRSGMGTTLTGALVGDGEVSFGHVGDSRAYRWRGGSLDQLTKDHSLVEELRRQGKLTPEEAAEHPQRSVITRALGPEPDVEVDTMTVQARDGDVFMLCSDGLTTMLDDGAITEILTRSGSLAEAARSLVRQANERGGRDNITVVLFRLADSAGAAAEPATEGATLIGPSAAAEGLTADAVRGATERHDAVGGEPTRAGAGPAPGESPGAPAGPWRRRLLRGGVVLAILALLGFGAWYGMRQVWFLGTDDGGRVALYRGLPYELPLGIDLYSEVYAIPVTLEALPEERRPAATNHELRSRDDAVSLIEDLQRAADAEQPRPVRPGPNRRGDGGGGGGGGAQG